MIDNPALLPQHLEQLTHESGISLEIIQARGYRSVHGAGSAAELVALGFNTAQAKLHPGLLIPVLGSDGSPALYQLRPDTPRLNGHSNPIKYETPAKASMRLDMGVGQREALKNPAIVLWITEGIKKVDSLASQGLCAIGLLGVYNFNGKNAYGGVTWLADWDEIALNGRKVRIVFDNDVMRKAQVNGALKRLMVHLERKKACVEAVYLPTEGERKIGVDDYLRLHTVTELEGLIEQPRPTIAPADPETEILSKAPQLMARPLALIDGRAYAATWLWVKTTTKEIPGKNGEVLRLSVPQVVEGRRLFIQRDDGVCFGATDARYIRPIGEMGVTVHLPEIPLDSRVWSAAGYLAYQSGARVEAINVFRRVVEVVNTFIDFNRSLADQQTMSEMVACYILSTWFLDSFYVVGFLWPNGDRGSGKTQLLNVVTELAYLGQTILAGGSYACLRDMADYGATLAFDDAENLSDPKRTDPDKRALLLAGNRRGNTVAVKEPGPNGTWHTRHVNTFCPRLFSAIRLPDTVLASRSIVVPLIRTPDRERANADPLDYAKWPHNRTQLIDDLWALALCHLSELPKHVSQVDRLSTLTGRNLEPWRPLLTMAHWLEEAGVDGLWRRMEGLSQAYQEERPDLESADLTVLTIKALCRYVLHVCDASDTSAASDTSIVTPQECVCTTSEIKALVVSVATEEESGLDTEKISTDRVGRVLGRMRLKKRREGGKGTRQWVIPFKDLQSWVVSYGLYVSEKWPPSNTSVTSGGSVTSVTDELDLSDDDVVELANGTFRQIRMPSDESPPVAIVNPEPESSPHSSESLSSPSVEVGASFEVLPYTYIRETSQLEKALPDILAAQTLGVDTETTDTDPLVDKLCLVQLASPEATYIVDARTCPIQLLDPVFQQEDRWLIFHNAKFDLQFLVQSGLNWPVARVFDTQLGAQVLGAGPDHIEEGKYTLETLVREYIHQGMDKTLQTSDWGSSALSREQLFYAARDAQILDPLAQELTKELRDARLMSTALLESSCARAFAWMELNGLPVDTMAWEALASDSAQRAKHLLEKLAALAGQEVKWNSNPQVKQLLRARGLPVDATNKEALTPYVSDEMVASLLEYRKYAHAVSTYGVKWLRHVHPKTGRVHSEFFQLGTGVGRSSSAKPNLQNIPRDLRYRRPIRGEEGRFILKGDFSQLHLRMVAIRAPEPAMQEAFQQGIDIHDKTAGGLLKKDKVEKADRQLAKATNFGLVYGMKAPGFQMQAWTDYGIRLTIEEAEAHREAWFKLYPGILRWHTREARKIYDDRITETRSYLGRRRLGATYLQKQLPGPVLGTESDGVKLAMIRIFTHRHEFPTAKLINNIHDELLIECDAHECKAVKEWMQKHLEAGMQEAMQGKAPTPVEVKEGRSWGEASQ